MAFICPVLVPLKERSLRELKVLLKNIPRLGIELERFQRDLRDILKRQPPHPKRRPMGIIFDTSVLIAIERSPPPNRASN